MANITDPQEGTAYPTDDLGQVQAAPDDPSVQADQGQTVGGDPPPPLNQAVINDAAGTGLTKNNYGLYTGSLGGQFGVHLAVAPPASSPLTVNVVTLFGPVVVSPSTLTFTSANFSTDQLVTVTEPNGGGADSQVAVIAAGVLRANIRFAS